jgi:hypothetical protein
MSEWRFARKRSVVIEFREVVGESELIPTMEGHLTALRGRDFVIRGVEGEIYPIYKEIFARTYDILPDWMQQGLNEPKWKSDLIGIVWAYARENKLLDTNGKDLLPGLGNLVREIRSRCDRCGKTPKQAQQDENWTNRMNPICTYQCCAVNHGLEQYTPKLCPSCHQELEKIFPHPVLSV